MKTTSEQATMDWGTRFAETLNGGEVVCLFGELGAGKTTLAKGIAKRLGITKSITSPTFALMNVFEVQDAKLKIKNLVHIDTYRLNNEQELIDIGVEDYLGKPDVVCVVEWPEKIASLLQNKKIIKIKLEHLDPRKREITIL